MAEQCARKVRRKFWPRIWLQLGDDVEPIETRREHVDMKNDEDEKPLEAHIPRARIKFEVPRVEGNKSMKVQDMLGADIGMLLVSEVRRWWSTSN